MREKQPLDGCWVLVVEDEYLIAQDMCDWLKKAGASTVGPVANLSSALESLRAAKVDLAVIDINLGAGPDFHLAELLTHCRVPFLFATGYGKAAIVPAYGNVPWIEKPFNEGQLLRAVCNLADRHLSTEREGLAVGRLVRTMLG